MTGGPISVAGVVVEPGERRDLAPLASESYTGDRTTLPMAVINGIEDGPRVFVTAAVHGDELNGIETCRRLLDAVDPLGVAGSLVVVPIVNVLGVQFGSRYLPDRRDLNRSFPGSHSGSMAARIARLLTEEVITGSDAGIDLHTAANHRTNVPQVRIAEDPRALPLATTFGAPFVMRAKLRPGSLRAVALEQDVPVLTYEGGQPLRFDADAIDVALRGIQRVLARMEMIDHAPEPAAAEPMVLDASRWLRAARGGVLELHVEPGDRVQAGQPLWTTSSPMGGAERASIDAEEEGYVIGATTLPLVQPGQAVLHVALPGEHLPSEDDPTEEEDEDDPDMTEGT